jgi:hypothetical protein
MLVVDDKEVSAAGAEVGGAVVGDLTELAAKIPRLGFFAHNPLSTAVFT